MPGLVLWCSPWLVFVMKSAHNKTKVIDMFMFFEEDLIFFLFSFWRLTCSCWLGTGGTLWIQRSMCSEPYASIWTLSIYSSFSFSSLEAVSEDSCSTLQRRGWRSVLSPIKHTYTHPLLSYSKVWWGVNSLPSFCVAVWFVILFLCPGRGQAALCTPVMHPGCETTSLPIRQTHALG